MDAAEFVSLGGKIMEVGGQLTALRGERDVLSAKIADLEKELLPLMTRYNELMASVMGAAMPKPPPPPVRPAGPSGPAPLSDDKIILAKRIKKFLEDAEPGTSATQIAEALKVDAAVIREVMRDMIR